MENAQVSHAVSRVLGLAIVRFQPQIFPWDTIILNEIKAYEETG